MDLWLYQIRNNDDGIRLALGRCGKSFDPYLQCPNAFSPGPRSHIAFNHRCMRYRYPTANQRILFSSFSADDGHPRLTRILWIHKLFFEHRRTPRLGLGRIDIVPKLERSGEAGAIEERQTPSLGPVLEMRQSSTRNNSDIDTALRFREQGLLSMSF
jgi:hypothetical protein